VRKTICSIPVKTTKPRGNKTHNGIMQHSNKQHEIAKQGVNMLEQQDY